MLCMTYIEALDPNNLHTAREEARLAYWDATCPDWEARESYGMRFLSERDMPAEDASADESRMSSADWEAMAEALWSDPAERDY